MRTVEWDEVDGEDVGDMATSQKLEVALSAVPRFPPDELTAPYGDQNTHWSAHSSWARPRDFQSWVVEPVNVIGQRFAIACISLMGDGAWWFGMRHWAP